MMIFINWLEIKNLISATATSWQHKVYNTGKPLNITVSTLTKKLPDLKRIPNVLLVFRSYSLSIDSYFEDRTN